MSFLEALKEAKEAGASTDDFMKTWHDLTKQDVSVDKPWSNLRKGNKVTSPAMADKMKRRGWISPDPNNIEDLFDEDTQDKNSADEAHNIESLKLAVPDASSTQALKPKPLKSPRALPRSCKLQPPSYEQAKEFEKADGNIQHTQQTERKFPHDSEGDSEPSSDEGNLGKGPPSASYLQQLDANQQTVPKTVYVNFEKKRLTESPSGPYEAVDDMIMSKEDQALLMTTVRQLQDEQEALKAKLREHDIHLTSLMDKQPSIRRTLRKTADGGQRPMDFKKSHGLRELSVDQTKGFDNLDNDELCVQIEQLYSNFCKMHIPANSIKWMLRCKQPKQVLRSKDDIDVIQDTFARRENSEGYWDIVSVQETFALRKENEELKQKIKLLEDKLEEVRRPNPPETRPKSPDVHMPTISAMPRLCNVRVSKLKKDVDGPAKASKHAVNLKKKSSERTTCLEDSLVAGCPVPTHPSIGSVTPAKMKFEWHISNYAKNLEMERRGQQMKLVSNPFYTNHNGYLAQMEVYLNGNSCSGQGRCLSVFLRILKGSYDHHLHWPVRMCFVITLVNQIEGRHESLKGGCHGFSEFEYRKPKGCSDEGSDCWGFVRFVSHSMMAERKYIYNDSIILGLSMKIL